MYKVYFRQVHTTRENIVEPSSGWANIKIRVWCCLELDFLPQIGALINGSFCRGQVTSIEHSIGVPQKAHHTIDLAESDPFDHALTETDIQRLLENEDKIPSSFTGGYIVEMWEKLS